MANPTAATYKDWIQNNLNYLFGGNRGLIESKYKPSKASFAMSKLRQIERMVLIDKPQKESTKSFKINLK